METSVNWQQGANGTEVWILKGIPLSPAGVMDISSRRIVWRQMVLWHRSVREMEIPFEHLVEVTYLPGVLVFGAPGLQFKHKSADGDIQETEVRFHGSAPARMGFKIRTGYGPKQIRQLILDLVDQTARGHGNDQPGLVTEQQLVEFDKRARRYRNAVRAGTVFAVSEAPVAVLFGVLSSSTSGGNLGEFLSAIGVSMGSSFWSAAVWVCMLGCLLLIGLVLYFVLNAGPTAALAYYVFKGPRYGQLSGKHWAAAGVAFALLWGLISLSLRHLLISLLATQLLRLLVMALCTWAVLAISTALLRKRRTA